MSEQLEQLLSEFEILTPEQTKERIGLNVRMHSVFRNGELVAMANEKLAHQIRRDIVQRQITGFGPCA